MASSQTAKPTLFSSLQIGELNLSNRIAMAPMTRNRAGEGNVPTDMNTIYYTQRASAGLIIAEAAQISESALGYPATPGIHTDEQVIAWKKVTDSVHAEGGHIFIQLWHVGRISHPSMLPDNMSPVAPSAIQPQGEAITYNGMQPFVQPRALTLDEIPTLIAEYVHAAKCAKAAGFDGVEIHAANGYLLDTFLRDATNQRSDAYGGSVENRMRLLEEVVIAIKNVWSSKQIAVRLSPENQFNDIKDSDPQSTFNAVVKMLNKHDLAFLHVLEGDMLKGERHIDYAEIKSHFDGVYMANMGYTKTTAESALQNNTADIIAFGQPYIANPDLVERFATNAPLNEPDQATFYGGDEKGYTDYSFLEVENVPA